MIIVPNPAYTGEPRLLMPECHDRSPFLTIGCRCGNAMHIHETQLVGLPRDAVLDTRCHACGELIELDLADVRGAFAQMRAEGWIA